MLATFGLERVESSLALDTVSAADVAEFLDQAQPDDVGTLARDGMPYALDCLHRRRAALADAAPDLIAVRPNNHVNPQFLPTRHADRV